MSSNSWAAFASGSFALAENYRFTTEAFVDYWCALSDHGFLPIEHQSYTPLPRDVTAVPLHVNWAFAVNGSASVIGSVTAVLLASSWGHSVALLVAILAYLAAYFLSKVMLPGQAGGEEAAVRLPVGGSRR